MNSNSNVNDTKGVVLSTRIRLARNLKEYPFPARLKASEKEKVNEVIHKIFASDSLGEKLQYIEMKNLSTVNAVSLAEKHLISPDFASDTEGRALLLSSDEKISIMLCEEDHARIQVILPGLCLEDAYKTAAELDDVLEKGAQIAFDERLGYLTQCPTNLGTGMRASVMLHLPALALTGAMRRLSSTVAKLGLTLRGSYGEGSVGNGDIYQLSNQVTLGISEQAAIQNLNSIALQIASQEAEARKALLRDDSFIDRIYRAYGILKTAHMMSCNEFTSLASLVRLGAAEGVLDLSLEAIGRLMIEMQPATLTTKNGAPLSAKERDVLRAKTVKEALQKQ